MRTSEAPTDKDGFLDLSILNGARRDGSLILPWPMPGCPGGLRAFSTAAEWLDFVSSLSLSAGIPEIVAAKFRRAQKLYFLAWLDFDLIKAGELAALITLELALKDRYGKPYRKPPPFQALLKDMCSDGLTEDKIPMNRRSGGSVIPLLNGDRKPSLADIRNKQAHGDPFDGLPWSGLLELVSDLIEYAYRDMVVPTDADKTRLRRIPNN